MSGQVQDASGRAVAGAVVTVKSAERGYTRHSTTGPDGHYVVERLLPGLYRAQAERAGFKATSVDGLRVDVDTRTRLDLRLEVGSREESIDVAPEGERLKTDRADVATLFERRLVRDLPNFDGNFTRLLLLAPGALLQDWQHAPSENPQASLQVQVGGQGFHGTGYQLDGTDNREPILGIAVINPTLESVAEAKVATQNFDAEFGQAVAAIVSVQTRSGTNDWHGAVFESHQNDRFQARNPFTQPSSADFPDSRRDLFGASLAGPLRRDRWFAFADFQGLRSLVGSSLLLTVPTDRARTGDLREYGVPIFDPLSGPPAARTEFPGAVIPAARLSPQAASLLALLPLPNRPGLEDNYAVSGSERFDSEAWNARVDGRLGPGGHVFARYSRAGYRREGPASLGAAGGPPFVSQVGTGSTTNQSLALGLDLTVDTSTALEARVGFYRYRVGVEQLDFGTMPAAAAGIPGLNQREDSSGLPAFRIEGPYGFALGSGSVGGCNCPLRQDERQLQWVASVTRAAGRHTMKMGVDVRFADNLRVPSDANRSGELAFAPGRTGGPDGGGLGLATFLLGDVTDFRRFVSDATDARERQWRHYAYAQDTWRVSDRLTVGAGLRLENVRPQTVNAAGNGGWLDLGTGEIRVAGVGPVPRNGGQRGRLHWAPRLSATYALGTRTVVRGAAGRSYDIGVFGTNFGHVVTQNPPVLTHQQETAAAAHEHVFDLGQGPPDPKDKAMAAGPDGRFALPPGVFALALPEQVLLPAVDAWNLTLQHQLGRHVSTEIAYVGNRGRRAHQGGIDINEPVLAGFPDVPADLRRPFFAGPIAGVGAPFGWTQSIRYYCGCGENRYDALQLKLDRRFAEGWSLLAHFTLQRARGDGESQFYFDRNLEYGRPRWDRERVLVTAGLVELPFGRGRRFLSGASSALDHVVGGWQLSAIGVVQSGLPFEVTYRGGWEDRDVGPDRPDLVGDARPGSGDGLRAPYFDATPVGAPGSAFARPRVGTFGNLPRHAFTGPGYWRVDASLFKRVPLSRATLELRLDVVNLFNHVNRGQPDGEVGTLEYPNPDAGFIHSTAYSNTDPQRNLQVGFRLGF